MKIKSEEVAVQDDANALEHAGINALALVDIVHIGAVSVLLLFGLIHTALLA